MKSQRIVMKMRINRYEMARDNDEYELHSDGMAVNSNEKENKQ